MYRESSDAKFSLKLGVINYFKLLNKSYFSEIHVENLLT